MSAFFLGSTLFALVGFGFILWGLRVRRIAAASRAWPVVDGRVTATSIVDRSDVETGNLFMPVVAYAYRVADRSFTGTRVRFGTPYVRSQADANAVIARYPVGTVVPVFVHPDRPDTAVLEPVAMGTARWFLLGTTILVAVSLVGLLLVVAS